MTLLELVTLPECKQSAFRLPDTLANELFDIGDDNDGVTLLLSKGSGDDEQLECEDPSETHFVRVASVVDK